MSDISKEKRTRDAAIEKIDQKVAPLIGKDGQNLQLVLSISTRWAL